MKTYLSSLFCIVLSILMGGCVNDDDVEDKVDEIEMSILPTTCVSGVFGVDMPIEGMMVKAQDEDYYRFLSFGSVYGFDYQRSHEYKLKVERTTFAVPMADGPDRSYKLIKVLSDVEYPSYSEEMTIVVRGASKDLLVDNSDPKYRTDIYEVDNNKYYISTLQPVVGLDYNYLHSYVYTLKVEKRTIRKSLEYSGETNSYYKLLAILDMQNADE